MVGHAYQCELALAQAFRALVAHVADGKPAATAPTFTYIMTPKQFDAVRRICVELGWPVLNCPGILVDYNAAQHPLEQRASKDGCSRLEVEDILIKAYSPRSEATTNRDRYQQAIMLNAHQRVRVGGAAFYGLAIVELRTAGCRNYLAPVTAYHATEAKKRALLR